MKVIVTGATGSLGLPLCLNLHEKKYEVVAIGRQTKRLEYLSSKGIKTIRADLCEENLAKEFLRADFVIHSAALTRPWGPPLDFEAPNLIASRRLFEWSAAANVKRVIHISTTSVYYDGTSRTNLTEASPLPREQKTSYASTKLQSEKIANEFYKKGLSVITLRPRAIISLYDQTLLPRILKLMNKGFFPLIDEGMASIDLTPVASICAAVELAMLAPAERSGELYNLTNDEPILIRELLFAVAKNLNLKVKWVPLKSAPLNFFAPLFEKAWAKITDHEPPLSRYSLDLISKSQSFDIGKIKSELGYRPAQSVFEALSEIKGLRTFT